MTHLSFYKAFGLTVLILLSMFQLSGCAKTNPASGQPKATVAKELKYDLGGKTINISVDVERKIPTAENAVTDPLMKLLWERIKTIEDEYNCMIVYKVNLIKDNVFADIKRDASIYDIVGCSSADLPNVYKQKIATPLDRFYTYNNEAPETVIQEDAVWLGQHYGLIYSDSINNWCFLRYNKTLISGKGLKDPFELMKEGNWTWEEFQKIAIACTEDTDKDGKNNTSGGGKIDTQFITYFLMSNNAFLYEIKDGKLEYALDSKNAIEAMTFLNTLYNSDKVFPQQTDIDAFHTAFSSSSQPLFISRIIAGANNASVNIEFGTVMFPKGPMSDKYIATSLSQLYFIPATVREPEPIARILEELYGFPDSTNGDYKIKNDSAMNKLLSMNQNTHETEIADLVRRSTLGYIPYSRVLGGESVVADEIIIKIWDSILKEKKDPATVLKELRPAAQAILDSYRPQ